MYFCVFAAVKTANLQTKKYSGPSYAEGIAVGVEVAIWPV
jgi:hypothetical protein